MSKKILGIHEQETVQKMLDHITSECNAVDVEKMYDEMLDECSDSCAMCKQFGASRILKEMDPTAYRCGLVDYTDSLCRDGRDSLIEIGDSYYKSRDVDNEKEAFISDLNTELSELENDAGDLDAIDDEVELEKLNDEIERRKSAIEACEDHAW